MAVDVTSYIPRGSITWYLEDPGRRHRRIEGTLVFVDISGFTAMSERLARRGRVGAEEVTDVLNFAFSRLLAVAYENEGSLLKFGGDALLLLFAGAGHVERACHAAHGMRAKLRELVPLRTSAGQIRLRMSVGIHSGAFDLFLVGSSHRELVVAGAAATRTVEMEAAAGPGEILVSRATAGRLDPDLLGTERAGGFLLHRQPPPVPVPRDTAPKVADARLQELLPLALRETLRRPPTAEHRTAVIAFVHFDGTDELLVNRGPDAATDAIDSVVVAAQAAAEVHGIGFLGTDIDADGGKVILTAGVPLATGNDEERMLRAARDIVEADLGLPVRIGVNRGPVFAGVVGPNFRLTYTVMGDAVNLAARVMARAEPKSVLATPDVLNRSRSLFEVRDLEPFRAKGKSEPVRAIAVGRVRGVRARHHERRFALVGRESELGTLLAAYQRASGGEGNVVELVAEPGIGKSRLVDELQDRTPARSFLVATCQQYEASTPYYAIRILMRQVLGLHPGQHGAVVVEALGDMVARRIPELLAWLPLLAVPLAEDLPPTPETAALGQQFRAQRLRRVVARFLMATVDAPAVVVVEDAHWLDPASQQLLNHLLRDVPGVRWLVVLTSRTALDGLDRASNRHHTSLRLDPLDERAARALVHAAAEQGLVSLDQVAPVTERAGGNPLFLQELVSGTDVDGELPDTVEALMVARLDSLRPADREVLRHAAVLGTEFDLGILRAISATRRDDPSVWERLEAYVEPSGPTTYRFKHALFRDAAYERLPYRRRRELHDRAGRLLEQRFGQRTDEQPELLALHFHRAGRYDRAWHYSRAAADLARARYANAAAITFYRRALDASRYVADIQPVEIAAVSEALGDVLELAGVYEEAADAYRAARRHASPSHVPRVCRKQGLVRERLSQYSQALRWYARGLRLIGELDPDPALGAERLRLVTGRALTRMRQGRPRDAIRLCEGVVEEAERHDDPGILAGLCFALAWACEEVRDPRSGGYRDRALRLYEEIGDLVGQSNVLIRMGIADYYAGNWDTSMAHYGLARDVRLRAGDEANAAIATGNIGEILSDQGRFDEAQRHLRDALAIFRAAHHEVGIAWATAHLGRLCARTARFEEAADLLADALARFDDMGARTHALHTLTLRAELTLFRGDEQAVEQVSAAQQAAAASPDHTLHALLDRLRGSALLVAGDAAGANDAFQASVSRARAHELRYELALALVAQACAAEELGVAVEAGLVEARALADGLGVVCDPQVLVFGPAAAAGMTRVS